MKPLIVASALLLAATPAFAQTDGGDAAARPKPAATSAATGPEANVYKNELGAGWENWSWAATEVGVDAGSTYKPIRVEAKGYQALYLHHAPFSTAPYRGLSLLIQAVGGTGEARVVAISGGKPIPDADAPAVGGEPQPKMKVIALKPGGWTRVVVPLSALGAEGKTIDGLWVQNNNGEDAPKFYVADITFEP